MDTSASDYLFPTTLALSQAEITKRFGVVTVEQDPDPAIHYKLIMPMQWGQVSGKRQLVTPAHPFELRSHFRALSAPIAEAKVTVVYVPEEVSPSDWLAIYLDGIKEKVLHKRDLPHVGGAVPDVLTRGTEAGHERISRWIVLKDHARIGGAHFFMLQVSTAATDYTADMANVFFVAVTNFNLMHPSDWSYAEQLRTLTRSTPVKFSTAFPASWQQVENPLSDDKHFYQVKFTKQLGGQQIGLINLMTTAGQNEAELRRLEDETRKGYEEAHLIFAPAKFTAAPTFGPFQQVYTAITPQTNAAAGSPAQERQVLLARAGKHWVYFENVRFTQKGAPEAWAVSKRAFDIVQQRFHLE